MAKRIEKLFSCPVCGSIFGRKISATETRTTFFCSKKCSCKGLWTEERKAKLSEKNRGENNPNYGNRWSDEQKTNLSDKITKQREDDPDLRYRLGSGNRGKRFSPERIDAMHKHRDSSSYSHPHSEETKRKIGEKSKAKFTSEYKEKYRDHMISSGIWSADPTGYREYYRISNWKERMYDILTEDCISLLKERGIFNSKDNREGVVRDHIFPRRFGFEMQIPYYIMRHPANCKLISHKENISKASNYSKMTHGEKQEMLCELLEKISKYEGIWDEQELCMNFIRNRKGVSDE